MAPRLRTFCSGYHYRYGSANVSETMRYNPLTAPALLMPLLRSLW